MQKRSIFQIHNEFKSLLTSEIKKLMKTLKENETKWYNNGDYSVYTGSAGIAFTFYHYGRYYNDSAYIKVFKKIQMLFSNKN